MISDVSLFFPDSWEDNFPLPDPDPFPSEVESPCFDDLFFETFEEDI